MFAFIMMLSFIISVSIALIILITELIRGIVTQIKSDPTGSKGRIALGILLLIIACAIFFSGAL